MADAAASAPAGSSKQPPEGMHKMTMSHEQRLAEAARLREKGNAQFRAGDLERAEATYEEGASLFTYMNAESPLDPSYAAQNLESCEAAVPLYNNLALCLQRRRAWSACADVPSSGPDDVGPDYALYVDVEHNDGTSAYGYHVPFSRGSHGWQRRSAVLVPSKPLRSLTVYVLFRYLSGEGRFDDVVARPLLPLEVCSAAGPDGHGGGGGDGEWWNAPQPGDDAVLSKDTPVLM